MRRAKGREPEVAAGDGENLRRILQRLAGDPSVDQIAACALEELGQLVGPCGLYVVPDLGTGPLLRSAAGPPGWPDQLDPHQEAVAKALEHRSPVPLRLGRFKALALPLGRPASALLVLGQERLPEPALLAPLLELISLAFDRARLAAAVPRIRAELAAGAAREQAAVEVASRAQAARDHLLSVVSHDLRNPLAVIFTSAELMLRRIDEMPAAARLLKSAVATLRSAEQLSRTITDLVDLARLESGTCVLVRQPEAMMPMVDEAVASWLALAERKEQRLVVGLPPPVDLEVLCDRRRLVQVLTAIIGNAVKFTPDRGNVIVEVLAGLAEVQVTVRDTGPGIRPEQLPSLFDRYWRSHGDGPLTSGLGLSIAKALMAALGGRIWVESEPGKGSTFLVSLPRAYSRAALASE